MDCWLVKSHLQALLGECLAAAALQDSHKGRSPCGADLAGRSFSETRHGFTLLVYNPRKHKCKLKETMHVLTNKMNKMNNANNKTIFWQLCQGSSA